MSITKAQQYLREEAGKLAQNYQVDANSIFELRLTFETPLMLSAFKADVPIPGLPHLDGILRFASFYWCVGECLIRYPELVNEYLWQVNPALRGDNWIDFAIPLKKIPINRLIDGKTSHLYDCSVGLPVASPSHNPYYPIGDVFLNKQGERLQRVVDTIPLRRRVVEPAKSYKSIELVGEKLDSSRGAHKALDNRIYNSIVMEYLFFFRGDPVWVGKLIERMKNDGVGIGKKSSLGYGQMEKVTVSTSPEKSTLGHKLTQDQINLLNTDPDTQVIALLKNVPSDELFRWSADQNTSWEKLLGAKEVRILSIVPQLAGFISPYWLKSNQTVVARYGSLLYAVP